MWLGSMGNEQVDQMIDAGLKQVMEGDEAGGLRTVIAAVSDVATTTPEQEAIKRDLIAEAKTALALLQSSQTQR